MLVTFKDLVSAGSLCLSVVALYFSTQAKEQAQQLDERIFHAETVHELLKEVHTNTTHAKNAEELMASCLYAGTLVRAEQLVVQDAKDRLVSVLFQDQVDRGLLPQNCVFKTFEELDIEGAAPPEDAVMEFSLGDDLIPIGKYHALIASYVPTKENCSHAKSDVAEFAELLRNAGLSGYSIYVARTTKSDSFAVTVDAGDDLGLARSISTKIKEVSVDSVDERTGYDSFVGVNSDWFIDPECTFSEKL
ncbi:hypothetical protein [Shimia marina]|uniref:Uncharacterized protein n=1 Tax=Shimia marina TaxID=321267 RepID=A0A0P1ETK6_9RHOB|nr:hypothetical protein [Shimia marina]CUH53931.1 hypothetical protein SHM7688_03400 [Shimia marina]SFE18942.1 hypothetical protein SAMN04488037_106110 [Shimia marina]